MQEQGCLTLRFDTRGRGDSEGEPAEASLATGIRVTITEHMTDEYILGVAAAIEKVARHFAV